MTNQRQGQHNDQRRTANARANETLMAKHNTATNQNLQRFLGLEIRTELKDRFGVNLTRT